MLGFLKKKAPAENKNESERGNEETELRAPFSFDDGYNYPNLYEEADEMLLVSLLMYMITDLRTLAKKKKSELQNPERILNLPLTLETALNMIEDNLEQIKQESKGHEMTLSALQSIQARYAKQSSNNDSSESNSSRGWLNPFGQRNVTASGTAVNPAVLTAFADEKPDKELVYAVGVDPSRRRVTVAFRGSVTSTDFITDACIAFHQRANPLKDTPGQEEHIGIHHGFDEYLLKRRKVVGECKYDEIMDHVSKLFQDPERKESYKLYVSGHSLGGALASLFAFEAALESHLPKPVTVVSVASPRVGDKSFQKAFRRLEADGRLRHLRIAHSKDPVTMMPKSSSKKLLAMLSPISYVAIKTQDADFAGRETYRHTGLKLSLIGNKKKETGTYKLSYAGVTTAQEELKDDDDAPEKKPGLLSSLTSRLSLKDVPGVAFHFGTTYTEQLGKVKEELSGMTLNELYSNMAPVAAGNSTRS